MSNHHITDKRLYNKWHNMMNRCYKSKNPSYPRYGERGIKVCERWQNYENFENDLLESFLAHIEQYGIKDTQLERVNNDGDYEPSNCCWATCKEQAKNRCTSLTLKNGELARDFCDKNNINIDWVYNRMSKHNMTVNNALEDILNSPIKEKYNTKHILPCNNSLRHHCIQNKYTYETILEYIKQYNLPPDEALALYLKRRSRPHIKPYYIYLPCGIPLKEHCKQNRYNYNAIRYYIKQYNFTPDEALARYLKNRKKKNN